MKKESIKIQRIVSHVCAAAAGGSVLEAIHLWGRCYGLPSAFLIAFAVILIGYAWMIDGESR